MSTDDSGGGYPDETGADTGYTDPGGYTGGEETGYTDPGYSDTAETDGSGDSGYAEEGYTDTGESEDDEDVTIEIEASLGAEEATVGLDELMADGFVPDEVQAEA